MNKSQVKTKPGLTTKCTTTPRVLLVLLLRDKACVGSKEQERMCMASSSSSLILLLPRRKEPSGLKPEKDGILLLKRSGTTQAHSENSKLPHIVVLPNMEDTKTLQFRCWVILVPRAWSADLMQAGVQPGPPRHILVPSLFRGSFQSLQKGSKDSGFGTAKH